jgi:hypothetical protein
MRTHHCRTIDLAARLRPHKEKAECYNEGCAVAEKDIFPLERTELFGVESPEECQVDVKRHGEGPQRISEQKTAANLATLEF